MNPTPRLIPIPARLAAIIAGGGADNIAASPSDERAALRTRLMDLVNAVADAHKTAVIAGAEDAANYLRIAHARLAAALGALSEAA